MSTKESSTNLTRPSTRVQESVQRIEISPNYFSCCHKPTVRKKLCCCDSSTREFPWHSEHKERGYPETLSSPCTHSSFLGTKGPLTSGNLMPAAQPPNGEKCTSSLLDSPHEQTSAFWRKKWTAVQQRPHQNPRKMPSHISATAEEGDTSTSLTTKQSRPRHRISQTDHKTHPKDHRKNYHNSPNPPAD